MTQVYRQQAPLSQYLEGKRKEGKSIGFVPTMGALHKGHGSLLQTCRAENDVSVCSIFVNPTQFNQQKDFASYPRTPENDFDIIKNAGADVLFMPDETEMYLTGEADVLNGFDIGYLNQTMEGTYRQGHFKGVATIVKKFLELIKPHKAYFGLKDYQQFLLVQKLVSFFHINTRVIGCKTVREPDGLAMSSRNLRLNGMQKQIASEIFRTLQLAKKSLQNGEPPKQVEDWGTAQLNAKGFDTDYFKVADAKTLETASEKNKATGLIICTAATLGGVRLIDNILVDDEH